MKLCDYCKEEVHDEAVKCKHCQSPILSLELKKVKEMPFGKNLQWHLKNNKLGLLFLTAIGIGGGVAVAYFMSLAGL